MSLLGHFRGVRLRKGVIHFGQTNTDIRIDRAFLNSAFAIAKINSVITWRRITRGRTNGTIAFAPNMPGPWYNARFAAHLAGLKITKNVSEADCVFVFDDKTVSAGGKDYGNVPSINASISDISKSHVGRVFQNVFGYSVDIDPLTYEGEAVQKSDNNATHDGQIVVCPLGEDEIVAGCVYQKLIDGRLSGERSEEMRIAFVGGEIPIISYKYKDMDKRFTTSYARVDLKSASDVLSAAEIETLVTFSTAMGLDFGAIDVLRDKNDGRIYVVDVNKTCMPVLTLPIAEQMVSLNKIAASFLRLIQRLKAA